MKPSEVVPHHPTLPTPEEQAHFDKLADQLDQMIKDRDQVTHIMASKEAESIIDMGSGVIQPLLTRLSEGSTLWYMPLQSIVMRQTGKANPVKAEAGNFYDPSVPFSQFEGEKRAWLKWGASSGYQVKLPEM